MATARQVMNALASQVVSVCGSAVSVGVGWPPANKIQDVPKGSVAAVGIFDRGTTTNTTRWPVIYAIPDVNVAAGVAAVLSGGSPLGSAGATLTLTGTPKAGDTVVFSYGNGLVLGPGVPQSTAVVGYSYVLADTLATFATALATAISTISGLAATAAAGVITIVSTNSATYATAAAGNTGTRTREFNRIARKIAVTFFCPSEVLRQSITDLYESFLAQSRSSYGFQLQNTEWVRQMYEHDLYIDDPQLQNVFRRDFFMECEYGLTGSSTVYPVLGGGLTVETDV